MSSSRWVLLDRAERAQQSSRFDRDGVQLVPRARTRKAQDHVVALDRRPALRELDPKQTAQTVAVDRERHCLAPDDESRATDRIARRSADELQIPAFTAPAGAKKRIERADSAQSVPAQSVVAARRRRQGASRARPFARREESTLRPPTVFIRARKPCLRLRLVCDGWNVRFMVVGSQSKKPYIRARYWGSCQRVARTSRTGATRRRACG
jgi:hypothetical protein